jgi:hypothetical protein
MESHFYEETRQVKFRARNMAIRFSRNGSSTTLLSLLIIMVARFAASKRANAAVSEYLGFPFERTQSKRR